jgi:hypothetical protein
MVRKTGIRSRRFRSREDWQAASPRRCDSSFVFPTSDPGLSAWRLSRFPTGRLKVFRSR